MITQIGTDLEIAKELLLGNQLVAVPSETVYGLAANAFSASAVLRVFEAKQRPSFDPLIVHIPSSGIPEGVTTGLSALEQRLCHAFWPGPLTLVLPRGERIPPEVTSGLDTVAVRMPAHPLLQALLRDLPFPLAAPSANPFGYISPTTADHVYRQLQGKIPYILQGGASPVGVESTIVQVVNDVVYILRHGGVSAEQLSAVAPRVELATAGRSVPSAPGMLPSHYAPNKPFELGNLDELLATADHQTTGVLSFSQRRGWPHEWVLAPSGDVAEAARNLFGYLRQMDESPCLRLVAERVPNEGLGRAINDRLHRAQTRFKHEH